MTNDARRSRDLQEQTCSIREDIQQLGGEVCIRGVAADVQDDPDPACDAQILSQRIRSEGQKVIALFVDW